MFNKGLGMGLVYLQAISLTTALAFTTAVFEFTLKFKNVKPYVKLTFIIRVLNLKCRNLQSIKN